MPGIVGIVVLKLIVLLHGPAPAGLQVWIFQVYAPPTSVRAGVIEQVEPLQFVWTEVYH